MKKAVLLISFLLCFGLVQAQDRLTFAFEYPMQYELNYHHLFQSFHGPSFGLGLMTAPFDDWIIDDLQSNGTDQEIIDLLRSSDRLGIILNLGYRLEKKGFFIEPRYQYVNINAQNNTLNVLLEFYDLEELKDLLELLGYGSVLDSPVTMKSTLHQFALRIGYLYEFNDHWGITASVGGSANLSAKSNLESRLGFIEEVKELEEKIESDLVNAYENGAYFYTLSLGVTFSF